MMIDLVWSRNFRVVLLILGVTYSPKICFIRQMSKSQRQDGIEAGETYYNTYSRLDDQCKSGWPVSR